MLVLSRRNGEEIMIGDDIKITVISMGRGQVRIGISAPDDVGVHRLEIYKRIKAECKIVNVDCSAISGSK